MNAPQSPRWIFDELPPSGARRGEDPSEHAFRRDLETFVRASNRRLLLRRIEDRNTVGLTGSVTKFLRLGL